MAFTSPERMLVTERPGRVRVVEKGLLAAKPLAVLADVEASGESGADGIDPRAGLPGRASALRRVRLRHARGPARADRALPGRGHGAFAADGHPRGNSRRRSTTPAVACDSDRTASSTSRPGTRRRGSIAQDMKSLGGKTLRLNADGSIPADNPFPARRSSRWATATRRGSTGIPSPACSLRDRARAIGIRRPRRRRRGQPRRGREELRLAARPPPGLEGGNGVAAAGVHACRGPLGSLVLSRGAAAVVSGRLLFRHAARREADSRPLRPGGSAPRPGDRGALHRSLWPPARRRFRAPTGRCTWRRATATAAESPARATIASSGLSKSPSCIRFALHSMELAEVVGQLAGLRRFAVRSLGGEAPDEAWSRARAWREIASTISSTRRPAPR